MDSQANEVPNEDQAVQASNSNISPLVPIFKCGVCKKSFLSEAKLARHMFGNHNSIYPFYCFTCQRKTNSPEEMFEHLITKGHHDLREGPHLPKYYNLPAEAAKQIQITCCQFCKKCFLPPCLDNAVHHYNSLSHQSTLAHWHWFKKEKQSRLSILHCYVCGVDISTPERDTHVQTFPHNELTSIRLSLAKQGVAESFCTHYKNLDKNHFACELCNAKITGLSQYETHFDSISHKCKYEEWLENALLNKFESSFTEKTKWFYCHICNKSLDGISDAVAHYTTTLHKWHASKYCEICLKRFISVNHLKQHNDLEHQQSSEVESTVDTSRQSSPLPIDANEQNTDLNVSSSTAQSLEHDEAFCYLCKKIFKKSEKDMHVQNFPHNELAKIKLSLVKQGVDDTFWLTHKHKRGIYCELCNAKLSVATNMLKHFECTKHKKKFQLWLNGFSPSEINTVNKEKTKWFYCQICKQDLDGTSESLTHYEQWIHRWNVSKYCEHCSKRFTSVGELQGHQDSEHQASAVVQTTDLAASSNEFSLLNQPDIPVLLSEQNTSHTESSAALESESLKNLDPDESMLEALENLDADEIFCDICKITLKKTKRKMHVKYFPHNELMKIKLSLVKQGVNETFWAKYKGGFSCLLCDANIPAAHNVGSHFKSTKHKGEYGDWFNTASLNKFQEDFKENTKWFYCFMCDQDLDGTSDALSHYEGCVHKWSESRYCECCAKRSISKKDLNMWFQLYQKSPVADNSVLPSLEEVNNNQSPSKSIISQSLETSQASEDASPLLKETSQERDSENANLKQQLFNQLQKLVHKLYYSKTIPYEYGLHYVKKINKEIDLLNTKLTSDQEAEITDEGAVLTETIKEDSINENDALMEDDPKSESTIDCLQDSNEDSLPNLLTKTYEEPVTNKPDTLKENDCSGELNMPKEKISLVPAQTKTETTSEDLCPNFLIKTDEEPVTNTTDTLNEDDPRELTTNRSKDLNLPKEEVSLVPDGSNLETICNDLNEISVEKQNLGDESETLGEPKKAETISDLLAEIIKQKEEVNLDHPNDDSVEENLLSEIEILLRKMDQVEVFLNETVQCLETYNDLLDNEDFINFEPKEFPDPGLVKSDEISRKSEDSLKKVQNDTPHTNSSYELSNSSISSSIGYMSAEEDQELNNLVQNSNNGNFAHLKSIGCPEDFEKSIYNYYATNPFDFSTFMEFWDVYLQGPVSGKCD